MTTISFSKWLRWMLRGFAAWAILIAVFVLAGTL